jgi:replicative DNA helicase
MMCDMEIEKAVIGCLMIDNKMMSLLIRYDDLFYNQTYAKMYEQMKKLYLNNISFDPLVMKQALGEDFDIAKEAFYNSSELLNLESYIEILLNYSHKRKLDAFISDLHLHVNTKDTKEIIDEIMNIYSEASKMIVGETDKTSIHDAMDNVIKSVEDVLYNGAKISVIRTGLPYIDNSVEFFKRKSIYGIGGAEGVGKSTLIINMIDGICNFNNMNNYDYGVLLVTGEDDREGVARRMFASKTGISDLSILEGKIKKDDLSKLHAVMDTIKDYKFYVEHMPVFTTSQLKAYARHYNFTKGISCMFVDHFNCITVTEKTHSEMDRASIKTASLQEIADNENVALFTALHRKAVKDNPKDREEWRSRYDNLQDFTKYRQKSAGFILINRDYIYTHDENDKNSAQLYFEKMRHGSMQTQELFIDTRYSRLGSK